jgi:hypothetical protein
MKDEIEAIAAISFKVRPFEIIWRALVAPIISLITSIDETAAKVL